MEQTEKKWKSLLMRKKKQLDKNHNQWYRLQLLVMVVTKLGVSGGTRKRDREICDRNIE